MLTDLLPGHSYHSFTVDLALKCLKTPANQDVFPLSPTVDTHMIRDRETFKVDKARTQTYINSAIPYL